MRNKFKNRLKLITEKNKKEGMAPDAAGTEQTNDKENDVKEKGNMDKALEIVMDYLREDNSNYAIMLDGPWGSGKSFFATEKLMPEIRREKKGKVKKVIYVSLYGISSKEEIAQAMVTTRVEQVIGKKLAPYAETGKVLLRQFNDKLNEFEVKKVNVGGLMELGKQGISDVISGFWNYEEYLFIFDDLERCSMPINDVLGYINYFIEEKNTKVLIIANEAEIGSVERQKNLEWKYFLAMQNQVEWPEMSENKEQKEEKSEAVNLEKLQKHTEYLFNENLLYTIIKEKLVGLTIHYEPELDECVKAIFLKYYPMKFNMDVIDEMQKNALQIMQREESDNLRTLIFALRFMKKIDSVIQCSKQILEEEDAFFYKEQLGEVYPKIFQSVWKSVFQEAIWSQNRDKTHRLEEKCEYGPVNAEQIEGTLQDNITFKFVQDYIEKAEYDEANIKSVLCDCLRKYSEDANRPNDPLVKLKRYWEVEDEEVIQLEKKLYDNLEKGMYSGKSYHEILAYVYGLKDLGVSIEVGKYIECMKKGIKNGEVLNSYRNPGILKLETCGEEYQKKLQELREVEWSQKNQVEMSDVNKIFTGTIGWGSEFEKYCAEQKDFIFMHDSFFEYIDQNKCLISLYAGGVKDVLGFRKGLKEIYGYDNIGEFLKDDLRPVEEFVGKIEMEKFEKENIKRFQMKKLKEELGEILGKFVEED